MKTFWKAVPVWTFGLLVGFYTTFVLQSLWNWFVATTLNTTQISYWHMYGFNMLLQMLVDRSSFSKDERWRQVKGILSACVPSEKKEEVDEMIKEDSDKIWLNAGLEVFGKLIGNTVTLALGWGVYTFLL